MERSRFHVLIDWLRPMLLSVLAVFAWQTYQNSMHLQDMQIQLAKDAEAIERNHEEIVVLTNGVEHQSRALDRIVELLSQK